MVAQLALGRKQTAQIQQIDRSAQLDSTRIITFRATQNLGRKLAHEIGPKTCCQPTTTTTTTTETAQLLRGNDDVNTPVRNELSPPIVGANVIRLLPHSQHVRAVCLRLELHGCLYDGKCTLPTASSSSSSSSSSCLRSRPPNLGQDESFAPRAARTSRFRRPPETRPTRTRVARARTCQSKFGAPEVGRAKLGPEESAASASACAVGAQTGVAHLHLHAAPAERRQMVDAAT